MTYSNDSDRPEWIAYCIFHYTGDDETSRRRGTDKARLEIGDLVLDSDGDVFFPDACFQRGDEINHCFGGYRALRPVGSNELRLIDPLGHETRLKFKGFVFCGIAWTSRWFRLVPRGGQVIHEV